jgi:hypothetical protein
VSLGAGLSGLGLSNAELARITAGTLIVSGGAIATDGDVTIAGIAQVSLAGASVQFVNNFTASGNLSVQGGDVTISAGATPVLVQASNVALAGNNLSLSGGTAVGAFAAVQANGNVSITANGNVSLAGGSPVDSDAWIVATGNISVSASSCTGCFTRLTSISPLPWTDNVVDAGLAANGSISVLLTGGQTNQVVQQVVADTNRNVPAAQQPPPPAPPVDTGRPASGVAPNLTDPNGTVGGEAGTFGGSASESSGSGSAQGSGGTQSKDSKPAKKANARC